MKIDTAEMSMGFGVEFHLSLLFRHCAKVHNWMVGDACQAR